MGNKLTKKKGDIESVYQFEEKLGTGSFAVVKRAVNKLTGDVVAIKIIEKKTLSPQELETLTEEVDILREIDHMHIVKLYDIYETKDHLYMVMELLKGGELFDNIVQKGTYSEKEAAAVMRQILEAVQYLHNRGIAHRDLKPENLIYQEDPSRYPCARVKITDFGLAKYLGHDASSGLMKTACGTPGYVAPEILKGMKYTESIDIWSLGVILFILLCGYPPFADEVSSVLYLKIRQGSYTFESPWWDEVSREAKDLVSKMLTVKPENRITANQVLLDPWFTKMEGSKKKLFKRQYTEKLEQFTGRRKLKKGMNAILASNRLKSALDMMQGVPGMDRTATWSGHSSFQAPSNVLNQVPEDIVVTPMREISGERLTLMIVIGNTNEEFEIEAFSSWNVAGLKDLLSEVLKANPHELAISFKRTVLQDGQELDKIPFLRSGSKIICARFEEEKEN